MRFNTAKNVPAKNVSMHLCSFCQQEVFLSFSFDKNESKVYDMRENLPTFRFDMGNGTDRNVKKCKVS